MSRKSLKKRFFVSEQVQLGRDPEVDPGLVAGPKHVFESHSFPGERTVVSNLTSSLKIYDKLSVQLCIFANIQLHINTSSF